MVGAARPSLLLVFSLGLTVAGIDHDSEGVATIGALGIVASLILPRMKGPFEFGPGGLKGSFMDDFFDEIVTQGRARGLSPDEVAEVAGDAVPTIEAGQQPLVSWEGYNVALTQAPT